MEALILDKLFAALAVGFRISGMMVSAPWLSEQAIPLPLKAALVLGLTILLTPALAAQAPASLGEVLAVAGGELFAGLLLGLALQLSFEAAQLAGQVFGVQTGFSVVTLLDPQSQADSPAFAVFNRLVVLLLFLRSDAPRWLLRGMAASFTYVPPGTLLSRPLSRCAGELLHSAGGLWLAGLQLAAPVIVVTMLTDVALGFLARAAPQLPVLFFGISIKSVLGQATIAASLALWPRLFEARFAAGIELGERLLHFAR
jgi:flagellar biosynthetic protein FliR